MSDPQRYRKKPAVIEAVHFGGRNGELIAMWSGGHFVRSFPRDDGGTWPAEMHLTTLEGVMTASLGDWVIKGVAGEFYPCKPDIFVEATYEAVSTPEGTEG